MSFVMRDSLKIKKWFIKTTQLFINFKIGDFNTLSGSSVEPMTFSESLDKQTMSLLLLLQGGDVKVQSKKSCIFLCFILQHNDLENKLATVKLCCKDCEFISVTNKFPRVHLSLTELQKGLNYRSPNRMDYPCEVRISRKNILRSIGLMYFNEVIF